jgi:hypothetical protein
MARPKLEIDEKQVEYLAMAYCTDEEIAAKVGCSVDTLTRRFAESIKKGKGSARASLRGKQFELAMKGNTTLLIWLGKQYLGQRDQVVNEVKADTTTTIEWGKIPFDKLLQIDKILDDDAADGTEDNGEDAST